MTTRRRRWLAGGLLAVQGAAVVAACGPGIGEKDCNALADALGKVEGERCDGGDAGYGEARTGTIDWAANFNCANITSVRDHDALHVECIPCLLDASCYDVTAFCTDPDAAVLPDACRDQLQL
jgi:hypothetical protein